MKIGRIRLSKRLNGEAFRPRLVADYYRLAVESQLEADLQKEAKKNARRAGKRLKPIKE